MTSNDDLSPEDVQKAQALAPQLDPDIARAITEGNVPVMQAIKNGARTDAEITQTLISMGLTTGLPPGLQQMVAEQIKQIDGKRDPDAARNDRRERTLADTLAAFAMVGTPDKDAAASSEAQARQMWQGVSSAELARLTYADWSGLSEPQKKALVAETKDRAEGAVDYTAKDFEAERNRVQKQIEAEGATEDQAIERMQTMMKTIYHATDGSAFNLATPEGQAAAKANIANLPPEDQARARQLLDAAIKFAHADKARDHADDAKKPGATDQQQRKGVVSANDHIAKITENGVNMPKAATVEQKHQIGVDTDRAALEGRKLANDQHQLVQLAQASTAEQQARINERTTIVMASSPTIDNPGFGAEEPAPPERKSIDCAHLTCSQLAPPLPEAQQLAANDPAPEPPADPHQPQKPAVPRPKNDGTLT